MTFGFKHTLLLHKQHSLISALSSNEHPGVNQPFSLNPVPQSQTRPRTQPPMLRPIFPADLGNDSGHPHHEVDRTLQKIDCVCEIVAKYTSDSLIYQYKHLPTRPIVDPVYDGHRFRRKQLRSICHQYYCQLRDLLQ